MSIKVITFDLDQTLIDFLKMKRHASAEAARAMIIAGLSASETQLTKELFDFYMSHGIDSDDAFHAYLEGKFGNVDYRILAAGINAYLREKATHMYPYEDVMPVLHKLKRLGIKLGIVSDAPKLKAHLRLDAMGIAQFFDFIVTLGDTGHTKDTGLPFRKVLEMVPVQPAEILHVGDWPVRDILGAKSVGLKTVWATYGADHRDMGIKADFTISKFTELLSVVESLNSPASNIVNNEIQAKGETE
jgi:HAD superfamily hydrolase (TIGR01549 family)